MKTGFEGTSKDIFGKSISPGNAQKFEVLHSIGWKFDDRVNGEREPREHAQVEKSHRESRRHVASCEQLKSRKVFVSFFLVQKTDYPLAAQGR